ncbi:phage tail tape measure protein [Parabacteroides merdae]|uniref:Phage tail tape measure protein n=1 Tax=Parabacteroides merdae TaxID=46503 RepID=A0AA44ALB5_9BACT|nr:phage tail tape measure protein [Parabacteroides merdae]MTU52812.1 phage tail tape measure protein [Parabacteroides merdae]MTU61549.1 phage tail tape measure protein [Parabacteroides merdae]MTU64750.1 phage tail tape measure protein [Parabacteroides merdae]MTU67999.1 phage tail tape measure protein [Parabacteroides merdae]MTU84711.1 phage tail tape measure protein [Parabacteroides merdae]
MAQEQNYQVNYTINVDATPGTRQIIEFGEAVGKLVQAKASLTPAVTNIKDMMDEIDRVFRTKNGKKRSFDYRLTIETGKSEEKLERVKALLNDISTLSKGISLTINAGQTLDTKKIKSAAKSLYEKKAAELRKENIEKNAASSVSTMTDAQKRITKAIGKINSALISVTQGRELNVKTDLAERRLQNILSLLGNIKNASTISLNIRGGLPAGGIGTGGTAGSPFVYMPVAPVPFAPQPFVLPGKSRQKLMERLYTDQQMHRQRMLQEEERYEAQQRRDSVRKAQLEEERGRRNAAREAERLQRQAEAARRKEAASARRAEERRHKAELAEQKRAEKAARQREQRTAMQSVRLMQRENTAAGTLYRSKRRAAINRIQYSKTPSLRNLPFASMLNAYMGYSLVRSELTKAINYSNIMESAHSILRVADADLKTFEKRFDEMARHVRKIGIDTKFTAVEIAGAVKYLSMAGMDIATIHKSIRPITNLAIIGDNDVSYIADLATNIMAGYDINNDSMDSVADIIASTISRSNVNIVEVAESYKMAAGYLRMAGVDFTESTAAIGLLGNMGLKGTLAGTSLRAMATRFAKPTKESQKVLDRLGVKFTEMRDIEGVMVEKLRPIADIFEELNRKGASMADMQAIFGKIGGNAAMMFVRNYDQLRSLTAHNRGSQGISSELALVKQNTTKGLWAQVTSQLTEGFMQAYQILEPTIRSVLRSLLDKFKAPEFTRGLVSIGNALLDIFTVIGHIGAWVTRNFHWIEPMLFTGVVAAKLFKVAGALTNIGIAVGFIGRQSAAAGTMEAVQGLVGMGRLSFAQKRAVVSSMRAAGVAGRGAMTRALLARGGAVGARSVLQSLFATQVATGSGLTGAAASLSAISTGAVAATAGIAALVGALGWVAYKTWKIKEAKDAVLEEIEQNRKYRYPSIDALYASLSETYNMALKTKRAVDEVVAGKTIGEASGHKIGAFTGNWWTGFLGEFAIASSEGMVSRDNVYNMDDARQDDIRDALITLAKRDSQTRIDAAYAEFGKLGNVPEVNAFLKTVRERFGQRDKDLDKSLWRVVDGKIVYNSDLGDKPEAVAAQTYDYARYMNETTVPEIIRAATLYRDAISGPAKARELMRRGGFDFGQLSEWGFSPDKDGRWVQRALDKNATEAQRVDNIANRKLAHNSLVKFFSSLRRTFGGSAEAAENIMRVAGFTPDQYGNEPDSNDTRPFATNPITNAHLPDDGGAGGNYSGTGRLSSAAPKQVIVNIDSLLSVKTIELMKSKEGQTEEIQNLKQQLAEALIDVVHDFDASWNA